MKNITFKKTLAVFLFFFSILGLSLESYATYKYSKKSYYGKSKYYKHKYYGYHSPKKVKTTRKSVVLGFPTHGTNNYYGEFIHDYSEVTNYPLLVDGPWYQVGLLNPNGPRETLPILGDILSSPLATTSDMVENFIAPGLYDPLDPIFNKPFNEIGMLFFGSQGVYDRQAITPHSECSPIILDKSFCTRKGAIDNPTLGEWTRARGKLVIKHKSDGTDDVTVILKQGLPETIYTMWLVGVTDNFEPNPILTASPLGGIPNVLVTDKNGNASSKLTVNYPILKPCESGVGKGCQLYVSFVWHPDGALFGGSPSIDFISDPNVPGTPGIPVGVVGSAQVFVPLQGKPLLSARKIYRDNP